VVLGTWTVAATTSAQSPQFAPNVAPNATGVTFYVNGSLNRTDATGPAQGSVYEVFPAVVLAAGDVLRAEWRDAAGVLYVSTFTVGGVVAPPPPPPPPPPPGTASLQWDASPDARTTGYRVYTRAAASPAGVYSQAVGFGILTTQTAHTLSLAAGAWCFAVTAIGDGIESGYSAEACKVIP
jgi:hypothetical protein